MVNASGSPRSTFASTAGVVSVASATFNYVTFRDDGFFGSGEWDQAFRVFRYTDYPRGETVPFLRLSGRWLEQRGFGIGIQVYVEAAEGRLILTNYKTHMAELFGSSE